MIQIGTILDGKYKILSQIGEGGTSKIWLALNERLNTTCAVKEYLFLNTPTHDYWKSQYLFEVDILKNLRHSGLPIIYDVIIQDETPIIVMSYIEGRSLKNVLFVEGAISESVVIDWAKQLCDILLYLHTQTPPIIYRDLKPSNILLQPSGKLVLIDFGISMAQASEGTITLGTKGYAAPEQYIADPKTLDTRSDIYALGITLHYLLTAKDPARPPYDLPPIRVINPDLSAGLEQIIIKCTEKNPDERYQSISELMYDLDHYQEFRTCRSKRNILGLIAYLAQQLRKTIVRKKYPPLPSAQDEITHETYDVDLISYNVDILTALYDNKE